MDASSLRGHHSIHYCHYIRSRAVCALHGFNYISLYLLLGEMQVIGCFLFVFVFLWDKNLFFHLFQLRFIVMYLVFEEMWVCACFALYLFGL